MVQLAQDSHFLKSHLGSKPLQECCGRFLQGAGDYNLSIKPVYTFGISHAMRATCPLSLPTAAVHSLFS